ncbi:clan AA aspartic protease [Calothrix sp. NIES-3974]|uniref:clan AA aspartic protease n=1 Tax=Calothrix sp. NIES-3974 TaxID=2005462 RepID=UPI000B5FDB18|nr:clan AA aspartic protease [Calothrix sp. NIES-3974]BAZ07572.1 hypothetical protein NIES3974_42360 [Calothrix sp. NIES-3974]
MIHGRIINTRATVPVIFRLPGQPDFSLSFVVDTAFNGYLTLPVQAVSAMNLPLHSSTPIKLADGRESLTAIHLATVVWDGIEKAVLVLASGYKPLLGVAMMEGYHLEIDFVDNGLLSLEKITD